MYMSIDLNIEHYELDEVINLFNIPYLFTEADLKKAKRQVLLTHPDKSNLDKNYFLFYLAAYRILHDIYTFRSNQTSKDKSTVYKNDDYELNENPIVIDKIRNSAEFNRIFNKVFEEVNGASYEKDGYDEWYKNHDDVDTDCMECKTPKDFEHMLERKRSTMKNALIDAKVCDTISGNSNINLIDNTEVEQEGYSSGLFGKLSYDDLKQAHENTIVPISNKHERKSQSVQDVRVERSYAITPLDSKQSNKMLSINRQNEERIACERAYKLHKQDEKAKKMSELFLSKFKQLSN